MVTLVTLLWALLAFLVTLFPVLWALPLAHGGLVYRYIYNKRFN